MKNRRTRRVLSTLLTLLMILSCVVIPGGTTSQAAGKKLKLTYQKTLAVNCTTTIKTNMKAKFKSSNKKIATVNSKGVVKGKKAGKVKITVTPKSNKKLAKTVKITVKNQLVVQAPKNAKATLKAGETVTIKTNLSSEFTSSNPDIAVVSANGVVTAKKAGTAKITVTSKKNKKLKKTVTITVTDEITESPSVPTEVSTTEQVTTAVPTTEVTTTEQTATVVPTTQIPTTENSTTEEVTTQIPTTENSTTEEVTTEILTTQEPTTEAPTTEERMEVGISAVLRSPGRTVKTKISYHSFIVTLNYSNGDSRILEYYEYDNYFTENPNEVVIEYGEFTTTVDISESIKEEELDSSVDLPSTLVVRYDRENLKVEDMNDKSNFVVELLMNTGEFVELKPEEYDIYLVSETRNMYMIRYTMYFEFEGKEYFADFASYIYPATEE